MKKIILALLIQFTVLSADYIIKEDGTLTRQITQSTTTPLPEDEDITTLPPETPLPTKAYNVLNYGLKGDGVTDDSTALNALAGNTNVTNWYFPADLMLLLFMGEVRLYPFQQMVQGMNMEDFLQGVRILIW